MEIRKEIAGVLKYFSEEALTTDEAIDSILLLFGVVGQSEQLTCPRCNSTNILSPDKDNDAQCIECAFIWAG